MNKNKVFEIGKQIGEIIGTNCNDEQIEVFEKMLKDYQNKDKVIEAMADLIEKHLCSFYWYEIGADTETKEDIIEYFTNQVKKGEK